MKLRMEWKLTKNELPEENVYVLVHIKNEFNNCAVKDYYAVARIEKGITEEEREKMPECERKRMYYPGDVHGNNLVPYRWTTIGPVTFFGQEVDKWAYIDSTKNENIELDEELKKLRQIFFETVSEEAKIPKDLLGFKKVGNLTYPEFVKYCDLVSKDNYEYEVIHQLLLHYQISSDKSMFEIIESMQLGKFKDFIKELLEKEVLVI